jgi:hypothetical protein
MLPFFPEREHAPGYPLGESVPEGVFCHLGRSSAELRRDHGTMKSEEAAAREHCHGQCGHVAESHQDFRVRANEIVIDEVEQAPCAVSPARAENRTHAAVGEHVMDVLHAQTVRSREVTVLRFHAAPQSNVIPVRKEVRYSPGNPFRTRCGTRWSDQSNEVALLQSLWNDEGFHSRTKSSATRMRRSRSLFSGCMGTRGRRTRSPQSPIMCIALFTGMGLDSMKLPSSRSRSRK